MDSSPKNERASEKPATSSDEVETVLFYDGECGLCSGFVNFVLRRYQAGRILFAPLQGSTAAERLDRSDVESLKTVVLVTPDGVFRRSSAIVRILWYLGRAWRLLGSLLWLVPRPLRNLGYLD